MAQPIDPEEACSSAGFAGSGRGAAGSVDLMCPTKAAILQMMASILRIVGTPRPVRLHAHWLRIGAQLQSKFIDGVLHHAGMLLYRER